MLCRLLVAQVRQELPDILGDLIANAAKDFFLLLGGTLSQFRVCQTPANNVPREWPDREFFF
jgi:hypothetical protein